MNKKIKVTLFLIVFILAIFCGCQGAQVENEYVQVFDSDVVKLVNHSIDVKRDRDEKIVEVYITGRVENILDSQINITISVDFYDVNNEFLGKKDYTIIGLRVKPNPGYSTTFSITYNEDNSYKFDHIKINAIEFN